MTTSISSPQQQQQSSRNKRKHSQSSSSSSSSSIIATEDGSSLSPKRQQLSTPSATASPSVNSTNLPPPMVALPPPLMQYPNGQLISVVHHPHQQPYYQMYHPQQQPFYYPVSPQQHPFVTHQQSPALISQQQHQPESQAANNSNNKKSSFTPRILPKNPDNSNQQQQQQIQSPLSSPAGALYPQPPPSPFYHPYALQMSPTMMPSYPPLPPNAISSRHNSISSSPGLGPSSATVATLNSTADQREKARKVSHSAIERRRRERINDKILQLKQLIPSCAEQDNLHKMSILQSAIDYISYLKDIVKSLDENGTEMTTSQLLKGDHLRVKMAKSMLPKEVEPFTTQFSVHTKLPTTAVQQQSIQEEEEEEVQKETAAEEEENNAGVTTNQQQQRSGEIVMVVEPNKRGLKPMDVIKSGTPIISTSKTPLTPPQEPVKSSSAASAAANADDHPQYHHATTSNTTSPMLLSNALTTPSLPSTPVIRPDETKHMSLQNILC